MRILKIKYEVGFSVWVCERNVTEVRAALESRGGPRCRAGSTPALDVNRFRFINRGCLPLFSPLGPSLLCVAVVVVVWVVWVVCYLELEKA